MAKKAVKRVAAPKRAAKNVKVEKPEPEKVEKTEPEVEKPENEPERESDDKEVKEEKIDIKEEKSDESEQNLDNIKSEIIEEQADESIDPPEEETCDADAENEPDNQSEEQIETPEKDEKKQERAESPLNILIGEEEENLLLQSGETDESKTDEKKDSDNKTDQKEPEKEKPSEVDSEKNENKDDKKLDDKKNNKTNQQGRSLWITNLLPSTRAQELKHLLSRYGKVIGAKVIQSSRHPRTRCYGYVTMETRAAADHCIKKLNNTELKGQIIRVANVRPEHRLPFKSDKTDICDKKVVGKPEEKQQSEEKKIDDIKKIEKKKDEKRDSKERDTHRDSSKKTSPRREKKTEVLTFDKIREERDRHRARERERAAREEEKRRREIQRSREIERRQREEAQRLEREREKLRVERERLDRQRQEILRMERERQKLEREKLEQEKQELRRQQMRLEEARRPTKRPATSSTSSYRRETSGYDDRKRETREERYQEPPPPPRFEVPRETTREVKKEEKDYKHLYSKHSEEYKREYKREYPTSERYPMGTNGSTTKYESSGYVNREREVREPRREVPKAPPITEVRYNERATERSPVTYRNVRDDRERRPTIEHHPKSEIRTSRETREHRYEPPIKERSFRDGAWHSGGPSPTQPFSSMPNSSSREWTKDNWRPLETTSNERWVGNSGSRIIIGSSSVPSLYPTGNTSGLSCPPPPSGSSYTMDRFENYKTMNNPRKY